MSEKVNKATHMFGLLQGSFQCLHKKKTFVLYKTLVRTHLDYASSTWVQYKVKDIEMIDHVQRRCTKPLPYLKDLPYEDRLRMLKLPTLAYHQWRCDIIDVYKMLHGFYDKEVTSCIKLWTKVAQTGRSRTFPQNLSTKIL